MAKRLVGMLAIVSLALALICCGGMPWRGTASEAEAEEEGVELTVYNQNIALVKDRRSMELSKGVSEVRFTDVASHIDPTSVYFRSLTDPEGTTVLEQHYEYDLVGSERLLEKYVGQDISLVTEDGTSYEGRLLSSTDDIVLQKADGGIVVVRKDAVREFGFPRLPEGLITKPTLVWKLRAAKEGTHTVEVTYLTEGLNWRADYVLLLAEDDKSFDLDGWVTLENQSGATYEEAKLKLVAGEVHRVPTPKVMMVRGAEVPKPAPLEVAERPFFEYHLYEVERPVTIRDRQTKQIEFVTASDVPAEKFYVYDGSKTQYWGRGPVTEPEYGVTSVEEVMTMLEFRNEEDGLGVPLPGGRVRVYKRDVDGSLQFVGEDEIEHTPKGERVRLYLGGAFDIVGERKQTDFRKLDKRAIEESFEITLRNHKDEDVEVRVVEHLYRWKEWTITRATMDYIKLDADTIEFRVPVEAQGEATVSYTVQYRW